MTHVHDPYLADRCEGCRAVADAFAYPYPDPYNNEPGVTVTFLTRPQAPDYATLDRPCGALSALVVFGGGITLAAVVGAVWAILRARRG